MKKMWKRFLAVMAAVCLLAGCSGKPAEQNGNPAKAAIPDDAAFLMAVREDFESDSSWDTYKEGCSLLDAADYKAAAAKLKGVETEQKGNEAYLYALACQSEAEGSKDGAAYIFGMVPGVKDADARREALTKGYYECIEQADGTLCIAKYTGREVHVRVPAAIDGKAVTAIGENAFSGNSDIDIVTLPDSIRSLGVNAFAGCPNLMYVNVPEGVTEIPYCCFSGTGLYEISLPSTLRTIDTYGIASSNLCFVKVPEGVTTLKEKAIIGADGPEYFTVVYLPSTIAEMGPDSVAGVGRTYHNSNAFVQEVVPGSIAGTWEDALQDDNKYVERASTVPSPLMIGLWKQKGYQYDSSNTTTYLNVFDPGAPAGTVFATEREYTRSGEFTLVREKAYSITLEGIEAVLSSGGSRLTLMSTEYSR